MERLSDSEQKAILKRYPDAWIKATKNHAYLAGYESSYAMNYLRALRGEDQQQKPQSTRKDDRSSRRERYNRQPHNW